MRLFRPKRLADTPPSMDTLGAFLGMLWRTRNNDGNRRAFLRWLLSGCLPELPQFSSLLVRALNLNTQLLVHNSFNFRCDGLANLRRPTREVHEISNTV